MAIWCSEFEARTAMDEAPATVDRINLSRGFFRLWLAIALFWIAGSGWILWDSLRTNCADLRVVDQTKLPIEMTNRELICAYASSLPPLPAGYVLVEETKALQKLRDRAVAVIVLPPLGLLIFGCVIFWVGRGFRRPRSN